MEPVHTCEQLQRIARQLMSHEYNEYKKMKNEQLNLRLIGVRLSNLIFEDDTKGTSRTLSQFLTSLSVIRFSNFLVAARPQLEIDKLNVPDDECIILDTNSNDSFPHTSPNCIQSTSTDALISPPKKRSSPKMGSNVEIKRPQLTILPPVEQCSETIIFEFRCPVCSMRIPSVRTEIAASEHVEFCLTKSTISKVITEDRQQNYNGGSKKNITKRTVNVGTLDRFLKKV